MPAGVRGHKVVGGTIVAEGIIDCFDIRALVMDQNFLLLLQEPATLTFKTLFIGFFMVIKQIKV